MMKHVEVHDLPIKHSFYALYRKPRKTLTFRKPGLKETRLLNRSCLRIDTGRPCIRRYSTLSPSLFHLFDLSFIYFHVLWHPLPSSLHLFSFLFNAVKEFCVRRDSYYLWGFENRLISVQHSLPCAHIKEKAVALLGHGQLHVQRNKRTRVYTFPSEGLVQTKASDGIVLTLPTVRYQHFRTADRWKTWDMLHTWLEPSLAELQFVLPSLPLSLTELRPPMLCRSYSKQLRSHCKSVKMQVFGRQKYFCPWQNTYGKHQAPHIRRKHVPLQYTAHIHKLWPKDPKQSTSAHMAFTVTRFCNKM